MAGQMERQNKLLPLIAAFKIIKAAMLFALAFGLHRLRHGDPGFMLAQWIRDIRIDPDNKIVHSAIAKVTGLPTERLHTLGIGTFFYGLMFATEGTGLLLKKKWAEYMTVITTATFLPIEIYELIFAPHRKGLKAALLIINVAILAYLVTILAKGKGKNKEPGRFEPVLAPAGDDPSSVR